MQRSILSSTIRSSTKILLTLLLVMVQLVPLHMTLAASLPPTQPPPTQPPPTSPPPGGGGVSTTLSGYVVIKSNKDPLPNAQITISFADQNVSTGKTDSKGYYNLLLEKTGSAIVKASYYEPAQKRTYDASLPVYINEGANKKDIEINVTRSNILKGLVYKRSFGAVGSTSSIIKEPLAGVAVKLEGEAQPDWATTDSAGNYQFSKDFFLPGKIYKVSAWNGPSENAGLMSEVVSFSFSDSYNETKIIDLEASNNLTYVSGKVTLGNKNCVNCTVILTQSNRDTSVVTDLSGMYYISNPMTGSAVLSVRETSYIFPFRIETSLEQGKNTRNIQLREKTDNKVYGTVFIQDESGTLVPSPCCVKIQIKYPDDSKKSELSNSSGKYEHQIDRFSFTRNAPYTLKLYAVGNNNEQLSNEYSVTFQRDMGEIKKLDITLVRTQDNSYSLEVTVVGQVTDPFANIFSVEGLYRVDYMPISKATVKITNSTTGAVQTKITNQNGKVIFTGLPQSSYQVIARKEGLPDPCAAGTDNYNQKCASQTVVLIGNEKVELGLVVSKTTDCMLKSQSTVKNFWICGAEAIRYVESGRADAAIRAIDEQTAQLRNAYPKLSTLPHQIFIGSSRQSQAMYERGKDNQACTMSEYPIESGPLPRAETVLLSLPLIQKESINVVREVYTHEWGHGKDYRMGGCNKDLLMSNLESFITVHSKGSSYKSDYFKPLTEHTYPGHFGGHPHDNQAETYASSFNIGINISAPFKQRADQITDANLKTLLLQTPEISMQP